MSCVAGARMAVILLALSAAACERSVVVRPAPGSDPGPAYRPSTTRSDDRVQTYEVQAGDTLYKISLQYGLDYRDIAAWNGIQAPYTIYPRQRLRLGAGSAAPERPSAVAAATPSPPPRPRTDSGEQLGSAVVRPPAPGYNPELGVTLPEGATPISAASTAATAATATPSAGAPVFEQVEAGGSVSAPVPSDPPVASQPAVTAETAPPASTTPPVSTTPSSSVARPSAAGWIWPTTGRVVVTYAAGDPTRQGIDIAGELGQPVLAARDGEVVYSGAGLIGYGELIIVKHSSELLSAYGHNRVRLVKEGDKVKAGQKIAEMGKNAANRVLLHFEIRRNGKPIDPSPLLPPR